MSPCSQPLARTPYPLDQKTAQSERDVTHEQTEQAKQLNKRVQTASKQVGRWSLCVQFFCERASAAAASHKCNSDTLC